MEHLSTSENSLAIVMCSNMMELGTLIGCASECPAVHVLETFALHIVLI